MVPVENADCYTIAFVGSLSLSLSRSCEQTSCADKLQRKTLQLCNTALLHAALFPTALSHAALLHGPTENETKR